MDVRTFGHTTIEKIQGHRCPIFSPIVHLARMLVLVLPPTKFQIFSGVELCIWYWNTIREECITMILTFYIESRLKVGVD